MTNTQVTHVQIDNYGPWTVTPEPRREVDLQTLQSRLYADLAQLFGNHDGYLFFSRFDNMIAVTNGLDRADHARIQESVGNRYPVSTSLSVATAETPAAALGAATERLQRAGSAQDDGRREVLETDVLPAAERTGTDVQLAHFDVDDATGKYTDQLNEFDTFIRIEQGYAALMKYMRFAHDSLSFFVGGDNVIAVCSALDHEDYRDAIEHVEETVGVELKVGVGRARTAATAGMDAKHALETCRETGRPVTFADEG
ncbi:GTP cyclohydrolase III [Halomicroarcula sp. GCM10025709]|uniref:GTP cyclohydrolase III n=1 Tax=Haloarcula TaxID=2237 RepID=UPI0024C3096C|nr:GTP cyclohydrolase III [Halomicroarcula sp. YJ-61-S]